MVRYSEFSRSRQNPFRDLHFLFDGFSHAIFVDRESDHRRSVLATEPQHAVRSRLAIFKVDAIDDRFARHRLQRRFDDRPLGRVHHQRHRDMPVVVAQ